MKRLTSFSFEKAKTEVDKCILLCANCHRVEHDKLRAMNKKADHEFTDTNDCKICIKCNKPKLYSDFYNNFNFCKYCADAIRVDIFRKNKIDAVKYKGGKCLHCNYDSAMSALEFHHINPDEKDFSFSKYKKATITDALPELDKCILLCANCHREEHSKMLQYHDNGDRTPEI